MTVIFTLNVLKVLLGQPGGHGLHVGVGVQEVLLVPESVAILPRQTEHLVHAVLAQGVQLPINRVQEILRIILCIKLSTRA